MPGPPVTPPTFTMSATETLNLAFDCSAYLSAGQGPTGPASTLVNVYAGTSVTLANAPTISGNIITPAD